MRHSYKLLSSDNASLLTSEVNAYLENGWVLHGAPGVSATGERTMFVQAVIRVG